MTGENALAGDVHSPAGEAPGHCEIPNMSNSGQHLLPYWRTATTKDYLELLADLRLLGRSGIASREHRGDDAACRQGRRSPRRVRPAEFCRFVLLCISRRNGSSAWWTPRRQRDGVALPELAGPGDTNDLVWGEPAGSIRTGVVSANLLETEQVRGFPSGS